LAFLEGNFFLGILYSLPGRHSYFLGLGINLGIILGLPNLFLVTGIGPGTNLGSSLIPSPKRNFKLLFQGWGLFKPFHFFHFIGLGVNQNPPIFGRRLRNYSNWGIFLGKGLVPPFLLEVPKILGPQL